MVPTPNTEKLSKGSHAVVDVVCDFQSSEKCKKQWKQQWKHVVRFRKPNDGKDICLFCSRKTKFTGRGNPNTRYKNVNDSMFKTVDSEEKAYLLGWIASDGHLSKNESSIVISIHEKDRNTLERLRNIVDPQLPISECKEGMVGLTINSKEMSQDICTLLKITHGKKSDTVQFPDLNSEDLKWAFLRGFFDGDGNVRDTYNRRQPECSIASNSAQMREQIYNFVNVAGKNDNVNNQVYWWGNGALDVMSKMYDSASIYLSRKRDAYLDWCTWVPCLSGTGTHGNDGFVKWNKTRKDAVAPSKAHASDSGYDLVLLEKVKTVGDVEFYDTGIKVTPPYGWYFNLVPRSSISKTGYMLVNSVGVIDRTYTGSILVPLRKINKDAPDIELPCRLMQIVPAPIVHFQFVKVDDLEASTRGEGGFGSTGV